MKTKEKVFLVFESRYDALQKLARNKNYSQKTMGEITWFLSLIKTLQMRGYSVVHCRNSSMFKIIYREYASKYDLILIMDYITIPETINYLQESVNNIYCMCCWGRDEEGVEKLGRTGTNHCVKIENVLTPFDYKNKNSFLGYNLDLLCEEIDEREYNNYGVLWGKDIEHINIDLVKYLCRRNIKFYATSINPINMDGVINLGILPRNKWHQLLSDCEFVLGSGDPRSGPTIIEALYYESMLIGPKKQFPEDTHNSNIKFTDDLDYQEIFNVISNVNFKPNSVTEKLCNAKAFSNRINEIFNLDTK